MEKNNVFLSKRGKIITGCILIIIIIFVAVYIFSKIFGTGKTIAKYAAFNDAGIKEQDVTYIKIDTDFEDFSIVYDIEFIANGNKYDYSVKSGDGEIIEKDIETGVISDQTQSNNNSLQNGNNAQATQRENTQTSQDNQNNYIGLDRAKEIALNHAGFTENNVTFVKLKTDIDNGINVYDIEFINNNMEYEYEINAVSGEILSFDADRID